MSSQKEEDSQQQARLDQVLADYMERLDRGEAVDQEQFLAEHPEMAQELRSYFQASAELARLATAPPPKRSDATGSWTSAACAFTFPQPGSKIGYVGDYELLEELGRGGMGVVYKARQVSLKRTVALKMILAGSHASAQDLARFRTEAEAVAQLQHPNIVQIHEIGEHEGHPYAALEFVAGGSLDRKLAGIPLPAQQAAQLVEVLARAVHAAHQQGIVHRDLKPANVLLAPSDRPQAVPLGNAENQQQFEPKIADFGLAKLQKEEAGQTKSGAIMGTPSYMAPEQAAGKTRAVGPAADVYSLGAILYDLVTGRPPFQSESVLDTLTQVLHNDPVPPRLLNATVPQDLETVCLKCLEKDPSRRYASAQELADDLGRVLAGEPIQARPPSLPFALRLWFRQSLRPTLYTVLVGFVSGLISWAPIQFLGLQHAGDWLIFVSFLPFMVCFLFQSMFAVLLVRPSNRAGDVAVGAASGLVFGLTLYLLLAGPLAGREFVERATEADILLLAEAAQRAPLGAADKDRREAFAAPEPTEVLVYSYPNLRPLPPKERTRWLLRKIHADMRAGLVKAIWAGLAVALLPVPWSIGWAVVTGLAIRPRPRSLSRVEAGFLVLLVSVPFLGIGLGQALLSGKPETFWGLAFGIWFGLVIGIFCRHRTLFKEALWKRH